MGNLLSTYRKKLLKKFDEQKDIPPFVLKYIQDIEKSIDNTKITEATYIVIDTELTGLNLKKDSIVSIGAVKMHGGRIDLGKIYYRIVEPKSKLTKESVVIHGITPSEASECPTIEKLLPEFLDFCRNGIIVGHFVSIDLAFINKEMMKFFNFSLKNKAVDTQMIYKWILKKEEQHCAFHEGLSEDIDLFTLANKYSIMVTESHNSLNDAFITAQLLQRFIPLMSKYGIKTIEELVSIGRPRRTT